ncbi:hypothetical protein Tco_0536944 [Tanacetum coccineum]
MGSEEQMEEKGDPGMTEEGIEGKTGGEADRGWAEKGTQRDEEKSKKDSKVRREYSVWKGAREKAGGSKAEWNKTKMGTETSEEWLGYVGTIDKGTGGGLKDEGQGEGCHGYFYFSLHHSMGTPAGRVILFGTIPTTIPDTTPSVIPPTTHIDITLIPIVSPTIPPSPDYTPASLDYSHASDIEFDPSEDLSSDHIPPLLATLIFLSLTDDSSDSDIPDTPPSPTHDTAFTETTLSTQRSPVAYSALRRRVMILLPGQPIPHG